MELLLWTIIAGIIFYFIKEKFFSHSPSETASAAVVMAYGIFIMGALHELPFPSRIYQLLSIFLILCWITIGSSYLNVAAHKEKRSDHFKNSMQIFAVGTWIAGTSVTGVVVANRLPEFSILAYVMGFIALFLWVFYVVIIMKRFVYIWKQEKFQHVHGSVLLSTVSTESLVVLFSTLFGDQIPGFVYLFFISLGVVFYIIGFIYIARRYMNSKVQDIKKDWPNTNCIIHGAMSITGLASTLSDVVPGPYILFIWFWVLIWYVAVEIIEIYRAWVRIRDLGFEEGIGSYNVTQWSRNFTFGMLYAFTLSFDATELPWVTASILPSIRVFILIAGAWIILFFIIYESILFVKGKSLLNKKNLVTE
ncbi:hypothetical protein [Salinibacillus kushneri]|nr:hypothetical protein [Salinibacillus kushneri]